jgi:pimeloyl-ACP methyl ester carboxylesterase
MLTEKTFNIRTVPVSYVEGPPSGAALVLLHGVTGRWQAFLPVLAAFLVRHHTYALDLGGHGLSGRVPGVCFISNDAENVIAFLLAKRRNWLCLWGTHWPQLCRFWLLLRHLSGYCSA